MISPTTMVESPKTLYSFGREVDYDERLFKGFLPVSANDFLIDVTSDNQVFYDSLLTKDSSTNGEQNLIKYEILDRLYDVSNREYVSLQMPLGFRIENDENGFYYINEEYGLFVYGETLDDARNNILEDLRGLRDGYCCEDDANLDTNALNLKKRLLKLI